MARTHRDFFGSVVGILVFLGGVALLVLTFKLAYELYSVPPEETLKIAGPKAIDVAKTGSALAGVLIKTLLLVVMGLMGSLISNRGISLYTHSMVREPQPAPEP